ncbi:TetR/AcrR family transcriptional regulator [Dactylosporangium sp. McL0621]|uniref:TetR/AcrR family transcriptional regulator n=1 Tax=Dactylosporangium sp. McL0621 TaxID=3415678 RepID=UPI003CF3B126
MHREHTGRRRNEAARQDILDAAAALIAEPGGAAVTVDAIAARAGVGKQTIYRWWPSKYAVMLDALLERARADVVETGDGTLPGDLTAFLVSSFAGAERGRAFLATAAGLAQSDPAAREMLEQFTRRRREALRGLLERHGVPGPGLLVEQAYGVLWYRLMISHEPLDRASAEGLAALLTRQADI